MKDRRTDWDLVLAREVEAAEGMAFKWGSHDCCIWACRVIDAMVGTDIATLFVGKYDSRMGAARHMAEFGGGLEKSGDRIAREFGGRRIPVTAAQRGDCVLAQVKDPQGRVGPALGIVIGERAAFVGPGGLVRLPVRACSAAWRV